MISSINCCVKAWLLLGAALISLIGCSTGPAPAVKAEAGNPRDTAAGTIAVLPMVNFSNATAPLPDIDRQWYQTLEKAGLPLLPAEAVENVITRNRIRYIGGLAPDTALAFRSQAGARSVLITILELYSEASPPKIAINARLVSTSDPPRILWIDGVAMAGDDSPGLLDLDLIEDPKVLTTDAMEELSHSLKSYAAGQKIPKPGPKTRNVFGPQMSFRSLNLTPGKTYRVAVVPFFNLSDRSRAGDFMALTFARALSAYDFLSVVEPGTVRQQLLDMRIIMPSGISLANADLVFDRLGADLIVNGEVLDYQDYQGAGGSPRVDFSAEIIERKSREVVWTVKSQNTGEDGILLFGTGKINTAHELARQMVARAVAELFQ